MAISQKSSVRGKALSGAGSWTPVKSTRKKSSRGSKLGKIIDPKGVGKKVVPEAKSNLLFVVGAVAGHYLQNVVPMEKGTVSDAVTFLGSTVIGAMVPDSQKLLKPVVKGMAVGTGAKFAVSAIDGVINPVTPIAGLRRLSGVKRLSGIERLAKSGSQSLRSNVNYNNSGSARDGNSSRNSNSSRRKNF